MGVWRRFKSWVKRCVVRLCLNFARTRFARFVRKIVEASAVPLAITGAGAIVGTGVASVAAFPLAYGALVGAGVAIVGILATKLYLKNAADASKGNRVKLNYTVWSRKEKSNAGRSSYFVETSSPSRLRRR